MKLKFYFLNFLLALLLSACTSGGDDNEGNNNPDPETPPLSQNACSALNLGTRIISGTECSENNSPVVKVLLGFRGGTSGTFTGSMITSEWVLTAGHCFFENPISVLVSAAGVSVAGESVRVHPDIRVDEERGGVYNDVALIKLVSPVTLPTLPIVGSRAPASGDIIRIYGYGLSEDQSSTNNTLGTLRGGEMRISSADSSFIDAFYGGEGSNTCSGDSGGPALLDVNGTLAIVGMLSSGELLNCEVGDTSRFSNTQGSSNLNFITSVVSGARVI